ncbi:glycosyltransferase [Streptomyces specialis]|uniref:glycosyltransferase n=1 Tax=Streptomyces specialis TaxID=498367 RepID=UPI00073E40CD|nr:glycosyltransferase [Streptomyces specialis]
MSRFLFVVPPLVGHINPAAAVAGELAARGHEVAWAGHPGLLGRLLTRQDPVFPVDTPEEKPRPAGLRGFAALKHLWEEGFVPLAEAMEPGVERAIRAFHPDVAVVDQQTVAGALVAERSGLPFVTSMTTSAELLGAAGTPKVDEWIRERLGELRQRIGDGRAAYDPRFSPLLTLAFTTVDLVGPYPDPGGPVAFVGPALAERPDDPGFPWDWVDADPDRRLVLLTMGTVNSEAGARFLSEAVEAVRARPGRLRAVVADPGGALGEEPFRDDHVLIARSVPQGALLERAAAVVCHAGHNTVAEALWNGVPLVVAPIRDDQPAVAMQVTEAGAGVRVRFARADRQSVGAALDTVLDNPVYAAAARRIGDSFRAAGGAAAAASHVEKLAADA